jgi:hypothetical protein
MSYNASGAPRMNLAITASYSSCVFMTFLLSDCLFVKLDPVASVAASQVFTAATAVLMAPRTTQAAEAKPITALSPPMMSESPMLMPASVRNTAPTAKPTTAAVARAITNPWLFRTNSPTAFAPTITVSMIACMVSASAAPVRKATAPNTAKRSSHASPKARISRRLQ